MAVTPLVTNQDSLPPPGEPPPNWPADKPWPPGAPPVINDDLLPTGMMHPPHQHVLSSDANPVHGSGFIDEEPE